MRWIGYGWLSALAAIALTACGQGFSPSIIQEIEGPMALPSNEYVSMLGKACVTLAESEVKRMNQIELTYKDELKLYINEGHPFRADAGIYMKWYRHFTGYRIVDIIRGDSFLRPIIYEIEFAFDFYRTNIHSTMDEDTFRDIQPLDLAMAETEYAKYGEFLLIRRYAADATGKVVHDLPEMGPREMYPYPGSPPVVQGWSPRDGRSAPNQAFQAPSSVPALPGGH